MATRMRGVVSSRCCWFLLRRSHLHPPFASLHLRLLRQNNPASRSLTSSSSSSSQTPPPPQDEPLSQWKAALARLSAHELKIDPTVVGNSRRETYVQALLGDKILGSAAAAALVESLKQQQQQQKQDGSSPSPSSKEDEDDDSVTAAAVLDTGTLTKRISHAVSNAFLAQHVDQILPGHAIDRSSEWEMGTAVEAAVCAVHQHSDGDSNSNNNNSAAAVADLARFLVQRAAATALPDTNAKGTLLERGGRFAWSRRCGGGDHDPVFEAVAVLGRTTAAATGSSKRRAEMRAAERVLGLVVDDADADAEADASPTAPDPEEPPAITTIPPPQLATDGNSSTTTATCGQWEPFANTGGIELENGERPADWWWRGAAARRLAFHRAMMAPRVFPDRIVAVDSWVRRRRRRRRENSNQDEGSNKGSDSDPAAEADAAAVFMVIIDAEYGYHLIPVETAVSASQARRAIGVRANETIARLVSGDGALLSPPSVDEDAAAADDTDQLESDEGLFAVEDDELVNDRRGFLRQCTVTQLKERLRERGLPATGNKAELVERLANEL